MGFTYNHMIHLNSHLRDKDLAYRVNYKDEDTAGVEPLGICATIGKDDLVREVIRDFFAEESIMVRFAQDGLTFSVWKDIKVVAAIIQGDGENEGKIFATQRGIGKYAGSWEFPGGKIESGEAPEEALVREIKEELDTDIKVGSLFETVEFDYPEFHMTLMCYLAKVRAGSLTLKEHTDARWLSKSQLDEVSWLEADHGVIVKLKDYL